MSDGPKNGTVMIVDDDVDVLKTTERLLRFEGYREIIACPDPRAALGLIDANEVAVVVLDLVMPGMTGEELLPLIRERYPSLPVIVSTGANDLEQAVRCMKAGAFDYVPKSAEASRFVASVQHACRIHELEREYESLKRTMLGQSPVSDAFSAIVTRSPEMKTIFKYAEMVTSGGKPVLVTGESGTGKELMAQAIHKASGRSGEFVPLNIAGLDDAMFSDTLFGHKKGAFTGADIDRSGLIEQARGGTLFLDEIGDLSLQSQVKLLRLIEDRRYYPVGSDVQKAADILLVTATNRDLEADSKAGRFRADLFFRLETHHVRIPPLRERKEDIPMLVEYFLGKAAVTMNRPSVRAPRELVSLLSGYSFPGNVRELESIVFDAFSQCRESTLSLEPIRRKIFKDRPDVIENLDGGEISFEAILRDLESLPSMRDVRESLIAEAMRRAGGNQGIAAVMIGMTRTALNKQINRKDDD